MLLSSSAESNYKEFVDCQIFFPFGEFENEVVFICETSFSLYMIKKRKLYHIVIFLIEI